jgi:hypothetical protein
MRSLALTALIKNEPQNDMAVDNASRHETEIFGPYSKKGRALIKSLVVDNVEKLLRLESTIQPADNSISTDAAPAPPKLTSVVRGLWFGVPSYLTRHS